VQKSAEIKIRVHGIVHAMENLFLGGDLDIKISNKQFRQAAGVFETVREFWPERTKIARLRASRNCAWMRSGLKSFSAASRAFAARRPCSGSDAASFSRAPRSIDGFGSVTHSARF